MNRTKAGITWLNSFSFGMCGCSLAKWNKPCHNNNQPHASLISDIPSIGIYLLIQRIYHQSYVCTWSTPHSHTNWITSSELQIFICLRVSIVRPYDDPCLPIAELKRILAPDFPANNVLTMQSKQTEFNFPLP